MSIWHAIGLEEEDFALPTTGERANFLTPNRDLATVIKDKGLTYHYLEFEVDITGNLGNLYYQTYLNII